MKSLPNHLQRALDRVQRDFGELDIGEAVVRRQIGKKYWDLIFKPHRLHRITIRLAQDESEEEAASDIASELQDFAIEESRKAWPQCPNHEHPMQPGLIKGKGAWVCPDDAAMSFHIGELPNMAPPT